MAKVPSSQSNLSGEDLRAELDRFFEETLRPEFQAMAERLEKVVLDEVSRCNNGLERNRAAVATVGTPRDQQWGTPRDQQRKISSCRDMFQVANNERPSSPDSPTTKHPAASDLMHRTASDALLRDLADTADAEDLASEHSYAMVTDGSPNTYSNIHHITHSFWLGALTCIFIAINGIQVGIMIDYSMRTGRNQEASVYRTLDSIFTAFFVVELSLQLCARRAAYFSGSHLNFHVVDCVLVTIQVVDVMMAQLLHYGLAQETLAGYTATVRLLRWTRLIRLYRLTKLLDIIELQMVVVTVGGSLRTLCWVFVALFTLTYMFALYLCETVAVQNLTTGNDNDDKELIMMYFGTVARTILTLYEIVSDGATWGEVMNIFRPFPAAPWVFSFFIVYVSFVYFGFLNVITGIFLNSAMQAAEDDKRRMMVKHIKRLFTSADLDNSGLISWDEFCRELETPEMILYLKSIDLRADHGQDLFRLLDTNESGWISINEFVTGFLKLHGSVKAIDFATFTREQSSVNQRLDKHIERLEQIDLNTLSVVLRDKHQAETR